MRTKTQDFNNQAIDEDNQFFFKKYSTVFRILMKTGVTPKELTTFQGREIDYENGILNFQGCKGHSSRSFKLKPDTHAILREYRGNSVLFLTAIGLVKCGDSQEN